MSRTRGGAFGKTLYVKNVMGLWIIQQCRDVWHKEGKRLSFDEIIRAAEGASDPVIHIDPDHDRFLNPGDMVSEVVAAHVSAGGREIPRHDVGAIARLVFESLALKYRYTLEKLMLGAAAEVDTIHTVGGGSRNRLLNQFTANANNLPVVTGPVEATAIGNIAVQAIGAGVLSSLPRPDLSFERRLPSKSFSLLIFENGMPSIRDFYTPPGWPLPSKLKRLARRGPRRGSLADVDFLPPNGFVPLRE